MLLLQVFSAVSDFLTFLLGRVDSAASNVRSGSSSLDASVADVLSTAVERAEGLKQSLAALPDAKAAEAARGDIDAAVSALKARLQVCVCAPYREILQVSTLMIVGIVKAGLLAVPAAKSGSGLKLPTVQRLATAAQS